MSLFNPTKTCVFSAVKARVTVGGQPLKGAKIIRRWEWNTAREDTTQTDSQGNFSFPAMFESSLSRLLPIELVVGQGLHVVINGVEKEFWTNAKREPEENAEFKGRPISLVCELNHEMKLAPEYGSMMFTLCTWEK